MIEQAVIPTFPPAGQPTETRTGSGESRAAVVRRANHGDLEHSSALLDRFSSFEAEIEMIDRNHQWPDAYKQELKAAQRAALDKDATALEIDVIAQHYSALVEEERIALYELKQSPLSADVAPMLMSVDRTTDPQTLTDIAEEVMALGYAPRTRAIIPAILSRLDTLANGSNDPTLKSTARAIGMAWREWQEAHPSAAARLRDIRARRDRVEPEVADAFQNTRMRLGMR
jgi:hypothetical protein